MSRSSAADWSPSLSAPLFAVAAAVVVTVAGLAAAPRAGAQQSEVTDALPQAPVIRSVRWVGHARLDQVHTLPDGRWISLGDDGLTILWDAELRPVSWIRTVGERVLEVLPDGVFVGTGSQSQWLRVGDEGTMSVEAPVDHAGVVACEAGGWWAWTEDETTLTFHRGAGVPETWTMETGAAPEARCVTTVDHAALYWPDGDRVRIISTAHEPSEPTWQLAQAVIRPVATDQFVLIGLTDDGQLQGVRSADGAPLNDAELAAVGPFRLSSCGAFDQTLHEECPAAPAHVSRGVMMPRQLIPFDVIVSDAWLTVIGSSGAMRLQWQADEVSSPESAAVSSPDEGLLVIYEATASPGVSAGEPELVSWTACRRTPGGLEVLEITGQADQLGVRSQSVGACPAGWWVAESETEAGLILPVDDGSETEVSTPVLGRNGLSFTASPRWEPSCGTPAWTVYRATSELEPTPISEPACGRSLRFLPLWSSSQQVLGTVALLERESGQWVAQAYNFVGDPLARATFREDVDLTTRFVMLETTMCTLAPHRRTARCWEDGRWVTQEWDELGSEPAFTLEDSGIVMAEPVAATLLGGPQGWVLWSPTHLDVSEGMDSRIVVEWSDGVVMRGDDALVQQRLSTAQQSSRELRPESNRLRIGGGEPD